MESTSLFLQLDEITANNVLWMAISEEGVSVLDQHSMQPLARYPYDNVVTFGGCQEDFMLVITSETDSSNSSKKYHQSGSSQDSSGTTKLLFNAGKPQVFFMHQIFTKYIHVFKSNTHNKFRMKENFFALDSMTVSSMKMDLVDVMVA